MAQDNLLLDSSNLYWDTIDVQYYSTSGGAVSAPTDRHRGESRYVDPLVANVSLLDFRLLPDSPAIGTGHSFQQFFRTDKDGRERGARWDVGALESSGDVNDGVAPSRPTGLNIPDV